MNCKIMLELGTLSDGWKFERLDGHSFQRHRCTSRHRSTPRLCCARPRHHLASGRSNASPTIFFFILHFVGFIHQFDTWIFKFLAGFSRSCFSFTSTLFEMMALVLPSSFRVLVSVWSFRNWLASTSEMLCGILEWRQRCFSYHLSLYCQFLRLRILPTWFQSFGIFHRIRNLIFFVD